MLSSARNSSKFFSQCFSQYTAIKKLAFLPHLMAQGRYVVKYCCLFLKYKTNCLFVSCFMVFNTTFNNISALSWRSVLLVDETGGPGENH
jgi:hypothetical protein